MIFDLTSQYEPTGDQPEAIQQLVEGVKDGLPGQVLLGVTGSGKTFTVANVIQQVGKPTLILSHNKTLAHQLYTEMKAFLRQLLRLLSARSLSSCYRHLYRERPCHQRGSRSSPPCCRLRLAFRQERCHRGQFRFLYLRYGSTYGFR